MHPAARSGVGTGHVARVMYEAFREIERVDCAAAVDQGVRAVSVGPHIYVDADACPVKAETVKVAERHGLPVVFVANAYLTVPRGPRVRVQVVPGSFDAADDWIAAQVREDDVVITADIPLAARCLKSGARVLGPSGKPFTGDNIGNALASRELASELRAYGVGGGPPPFGPRDRSRFLDALENVVRLARKARETAEQSRAAPGT